MHTAKIILILLICYSGSFALQQAVDDSIYTMDVELSNAEVMTTCNDSLLRLKNGHIAVASDSVKASHTSDQSHNSDSLGGKPAAYYDTVGNGLFLKLDQTTPQTVENGAPTFTAGINLPNTVSDVTGIIYKDDEPVFHDYHNPTGGGSVPAGWNLFLGEGAGNFTFGSNATSATESSYNIGIGRALYSLTRGHRNTAIGYVAGGNITTGTQNVYLGALAGYLNNTGSNNFGMGYQALYRSYTGENNIAIGRLALTYLNATCKAISAFADYSGTVAGTVLATSSSHGLPAGITTGLRIAGTINYDGNSYTVTYVDANHFYFTHAWDGDDGPAWWDIYAEGKNNIGIGALAGYKLTKGSNSVFIGYNSGVSTSQLSTANNSTAIGANSYTTADNQIVLGDGNIEETVLLGDNNLLLFGAAKDAGITYDGTNLIFDSRLIGTGNYSFTGGTVGIENVPTSNIDTILVDSAGTLKKRTASSITAGTADTLIIPTDSSFLTFADSTDSIVKISSIQYDQNTGNATFPRNIYLTDNGLSFDISKLGTDQSIWLSNGGFPEPDSGAYLGLRGQNNSTRPSDAVLSAGNNGELWLQTFTSAYFGFPGQYGIDSSVYIKPITYPGYMWGIGSTGDYGLIHGGNGRAALLVKDDTIRFSTYDNEYPSIIKIDSLEKYTSGGYQFLVRRLSDNVVVQINPDSMAIPVTADSCRASHISDSTKKVPAPIYINGNNVGIGTSSPDGKVHIMTTSAGTVTSSTLADNLVVEDSLATGMSILSSDSGYSRFYFGTASDNIGSYFRWGRDTIFIIGTSRAGANIDFRSGDDVLAASITADRDLIVSDETGTHNIVDDIAEKLPLHGKADSAVISDSTKKVPAHGVDIGYIPYSNSATTFTESPVFIDAGKVGIGTVAPSAALHLYAGNSSASPNVYARSIIEDDTHCALQFISPNTTGQFILFGDPENALAGVIGYVHSSNQMYLSTNGTQRISISGDGTVNFSTVANAGTDTDKFLVQDASGNIDYRTGDELLSDLSVAGYCLKLDQTTPQTVENGAPIFDKGIQSNDNVIIQITDLGTYWKASDDRLSVVNSDSYISIVSDESATWGSALNFKQVDFTSKVFDNQWSIIRQTNENGSGDGSLQIKYGTNVTPTGNTTFLKISTDGTLNISHAVNAGTDTDKFLVLDASGNIDYRTGDGVLSDLISVDTDVAVYLYDNDGLKATGSCRIKIFNEEVTICVPSLSATTTAAGAYIKVNYTLPTMEKSSTYFNVPLHKNGIYISGMANYTGSNEFYLRDAGGTDLGIGSDRGIAACYIRYMKQ